MKIFLIYLNKSTLVKLHRRSKLEDKGEHLSPKYAPDIIAPPTKFKLRLDACAIIIRGMPIELIVPKEVPIKKDVKAGIKKQNKINRLGLIYFSE
nr:hypothetical protein [Terrisporobacter glycolicus]